MENHTINVLVKNEIPNYPANHKTDGEEKEEILEQLVIYSKYLKIYHQGKTKQNKTTKYSPMK